MSQGKRMAPRVIAGVIAAIVVAAAIATGLSAKALSNALENQGKLPDDAESAQSADSGASNGSQSSSADVPAGSTGADSGLYHTVPSADHSVVDEDTGLRFIDNELVVYVKGGTSSEEFSQYVQGFGGEIVGYIDAVNSYQVRFGDAYSYEGLRELADELEESDMVKRALPNLVSGWDASAETGDPAWDSDDDVWGYRAIHLADAWDSVVASEGVTVGVLDNQFFQHEDLAFSDISNPNYDDNATSPSHGTHVSGTIAAMANSSGSVGVAYGCSLAAYSWLGDIIDGEDSKAVSATDNFSFNVGVAYLVARKNARVVNISASKVGDGGESLAFCATRGNQDALNIVRAHAEHGTVFLSALLESHDFLICKAAGNDNNDEYVSVNGPTTVVDEHGSNRTFRLGYVPYKYADQVYSTEKQIAEHLDDDGDVDAANDVMGHITESDVASHIVMVGAAGRTSRGSDYRVSSFSNAGRRVDLVAPGENIYSTVCENGGSGYSGDWSGTSMATPMVSGAAALVYSVDPTFTGDQVKNILDSTASGTYRYEDDRFSDSYSMLDVGAAVGEAKRLSGSDGGSGGAHERDIALVLDVSGSMEGEPLKEMKAAASKFSATVFQNDARVGVVAFDALAERVIGFTTSQDKLDDAVDDMSAGSSTNIYDGLKHAALMLNASSANKRIIVLMTDGMPNEGLVGDELVAYADALKRQGVLVYTLGFFSSLDESDKAEAQQLLERIASSGCHYEVTDASDLKFFFGDIADQINGVKYNYIRIACPVDVSVTYDGETLSSEGTEKAQRASFGTLTFEQADAKAVAGGSTQGEGGSSGASSGADAGTTSGADLVKVLRLREGPAYDVRISGTGSGSMDYTIGFVNDEGDYDDLRYFDDIDISSRTEISTVAQRADVTQLDVDSDGDGRVDLTYAARANQHARLIDNVGISASAMALAASAVALIAAAVAFIWFILFGRRLFAR